MKAFGFKLCVCGIEERDCLKQQARAQTSEPCDDRVAARAAENPCHYCVGMPDSYEVGLDGKCIACGGTQIHPEGDDPHDDGEGWDGKGCGVCAHARNNT